MHNEKKSTMDSLEVDNLKKLFGNKRVFVTGDTGFKGSWLGLWLHELGADVLGYALPAERNSHFKLLGLDRLIHHVNGDMCDYPHLKRVLTAFKPQIIFHLAAQAIVRVSYLEPKTTFDTNIGGSVNLLELVRKFKQIKSVIYVTSDKCYLNKELIRGYKENDELGGKDPYSASKAAAEMVFFAYWNSFLSANKNLGIASVRAGNVIGGGDWAKDRIIPDCFRNFKRGKSILIRNPNATRPWQHVLDPLHGYLKLAILLYQNPMKYSGSYNFGPDFRSIRTVKELAQKLVHYLGKGNIKVVKENNAPHESRLLHLDCRKANSILDWRLIWGFDRAVFETVEWYKKVLGGAPALSITKKQINDFMGGG